MAGQWRLLPVKTWTLMQRVCVFVLVPIRAAAAYCAGASSLTSTFTSKAQALQGSLC